MSIGGQGDFGGEVVVVGWAAGGTGAEGGNELLQANSYIRGKGWTAKVIVDAVKGEDTDRIVEFANQVHVRPGGVEFSKGEMPGARACFNRNGLDLEYYSRSCDGVYVDEIGASVWNEHVLTGRFENSFVGIALVLGTPGARAGCNQSIVEYICRCTNDTTLRNGVNGDT